MIVQTKKISATAFAFFIGVFSAFAQDNEPPQPRPMATNGPPNPPGFPIDNGLLFLFAIALIYGVYVILKMSKKNTQI